MLGDIRWSWLKNGRNARCKGISCQILTCKTRTAESPDEIKTAENLSTSSIKGNKLQLTLDECECFIVAVNYIYTFTL